MIFNVVIGSSREEPRYIFPAVAVNFMKLKELFFLVVGPRLLVNSRVEVIVPSLSALFACPLCDVVGVF